MSLVIRPAQEGDFDAFFVYLDDHLRDNGRDGAPLFQPLPRAASTFPPERQASFRDGAGIPVGAPGWRRLWLAFDGQRIAGHIDLRARPELAWIDLEVLSANAPARALYARAGFVQTGELADMFRIDGEALGYTYMSRPAQPSFPAQAGIDDRLSTRHRSSRRKQKQPEHSRARAGKKRRQQPLPPLGPSQVFTW